MMKKLGALLLAIVMILSMTAVAWAADGDTTSAKDTYTGSGQPEAIGVSGKTKIPLTKSIIFFNLNESTVYEPNITFTYAVAPDTSVAADGSTATVTDDGRNNDGTPVTRNVYPGPTSGVTGMDITFTSDKAKSASSSGVEVEESGELTVDLSKFTRPGIYRYKITETVKTPSTGASDNEKIQAAGLTARDTAYDNTRYLDVYIRNASTSTADTFTAEMYGAVIFKSTATTAGADSITAGTTEEPGTEKTTGFQPGVKDNGSTPSYESDKNVDKYTTYDFTVKKTVSGSMGDKTHNFPFYVSIANTITGAKYTYVDDPGTGNGTAETIENAAITKGTDGNTSALKLKDGEYVKFIGVPSNQSTELAVVIKEFNDTYDQYTASVTAVKGAPSIAQTNGVTGTTGVMTGSTGSIETASFAVKTNDVAAQIITVNNDLTEISPTGVVLRFAPYALILGAGVVLLLISHRRKAAGEED